MELIVIGVLAVLSVPIMLIVALFKLSWIEEQLSSLGKKIEKADATGNLKSVPMSGAPVEDKAEEPEMKNRIEKQDMTGGSGVSPLQERGNVIFDEKRRDGASPRHEADVVEKRRDGASPSQEADVDEKRRDGASPSQEEDVYEKRRDAASPSQNDDSYEPTAFDMFWMRIEDWLAVRGDFAPKGMTHGGLFYREHEEERNGNATVDAFPGFTYDAKTNGYSKTSFLWRFFRYENDPKEGKKVDLFFIPVWR